LLLPLVYPLSLLSVGAAASPSSMSWSLSSSLSSSLGVQQERDRHRGMHLHMMCLGGIADLLEEEDKEQCDKGGAAGNNEDNDRQGNGSKLFGVGGGGGDNKDGRQRRVEKAYQWARYTSLSHLGNASVWIPSFAGPCSQCWAERFPLQTTTTMTMMKMMTRSKKRQTTATKSTLTQTISIRKAYALQACHGAVNGIVNPLHEDVCIERHSRPCPGGEDVACSTCQMR
jgi:hypothetical protein